MKTIGILGGMGPSATARFYQMVIDKCQEAGLRKNQDYPHILIYNLPVPDFISDRESEKTAIKMIIGGLSKLEKLGADFIVIPCNTVHLHIDEFRKSVSVPIFSLIEETVKQVNCNRVGIIGTKTAIEERLYQSKLDLEGIGYILPKNIDEISEIIKRIVSGTNTEADRNFVLEEISNMGVADGIILGCTELPLIIKQEDTSVPILDTLDILANRAVSETLKTEKSK